MARQVRRHTWTTAGRTPELAFPLPPLPHQPQRRQPTVRSWTCPHQHPPLLHPPHVNCRANRRVSSALSLRQAAAHLWHTTMLRTVPKPPPASCSHRQSSCTYLCTTKATASPPYLTECCAQDATGAPDQITQAGCARAGRDVRHMSHQMRQCTTK